MKKKNELPNKIPIFPLSNFIFFPDTTVPLNIFETRYIEMVDDSMKGSRMIGMIQPKKTFNNSMPELYNVGCVGKITSFNEFHNDINSNKKEIKFTDLELIFKNLKTLFQKRGYIINWKELEKQDLDQTINTLSMASPFSLEEKQALLEAKNLDSRKAKLEEILKTYVVDDFNNTTIQ